MVKSTAVEQLHEAITAIAVLDPNTLTDSELDEMVVALQRAGHRLARGRRVVSVRILVARATWIRTKAVAGRWRDHR